MRKSPQRSSRGHAEGDRRHAENWITIGDALKAVSDNLRVNGRKSVVCPRCKAACTEEGHTNDAQRRTQHPLQFFASDRRMSTVTTAEIENKKRTVSHPRQNPPPSIGNWPRSGLLPSELQALLKFVYATGWRFTSEVHPLTGARFGVLAASRARRLSARK